MPEKVITQTQIVNSVVDQMIADKGLQLADAERKELRDRLAAQMEERIEMQMLAALSDEELAQLNTLLENEASDEELDKFFGGLKVNFQDVAKEAMVEFREDFLKGKLEEQDAE